MTDEARVRYLWMTAVKAAHTHDARGMLDPDRCAECGLDIHLHLSTVETPEFRFTTEVLAALANVRREERERCARIAETWAERQNAAALRKLADDCPASATEHEGAAMVGRVIADAIRKESDK